MLFRPHRVLGRLDLSRRFEDAYCVSLGALIEPDHCAELSDAPRRRGKSMNPHQPAPRRLH